MAYLGQQLGKGVANRSTFTASGSETSVNVESTYVVGQLDVYMNGVKLVDGVDYTASNGTSITGLTALASGDIIEFVALDTFTAANMISPSGGTFSGDVTIANGTNDLDIASHDGTNGLKLGGTLVTATAAELNLLDGVTSSATEINYNDISALGTAEVGKVVTSSATGDVTFVNSTNDIDIASHDGTNGLKLGGTLVTATAAELNLLDGVTSVGSPSITDNGNSNAMTIDANEDISLVGSLTGTSLKQNSNQNLSGTYGSHELFIADGYTLTGNITVTDDLVLTKLSDDGTSITLTTDGNSQTITGSGSIESSTLAQTPVTSVTGMTGVLDSAVTGSPALNLDNATGSPAITGFGTVTSGTLGSGVTGSPALNLGNATFPTGHVIQHKMMRSTNHGSRSGTGSGGSIQELDSDFRLTITPKYANSMLKMMWQWSGETAYNNSAVWRVGKDGTTPSQVSGYESYRTNNYWSGVTIGWNYGDNDNDSTPSSRQMHFFVPAENTNERFYTITWQPGNATSSAYSFYYGRTIGSAGTGDYETAATWGWIEEIAGPYGDIKL